VKSGNRIHISEKVSGVLLVPGGRPTVHTLQPGQLATVIRLIPESQLVEIDACGQRMLFSRDSLQRHGEMVAAASVIANA
jgi:hypothetical protein